MGIPVNHPAIQDAIRKGLIQEVRAPALVGWSEAEFQAEVERLAKANGWLAYHTRDSRKSAAGFPDLVMLRGPRQVVAELKVEGGELSASQRTWGEGFEAAADERHQYFVWWPKDWNEIERVLR